MTLQLRPFAPTDADYEACVAVNNAVYPDYPDTVEEWRHHDNHRDPKGKFQRFVSAVDGQIVALGSYFQPTWAFHPQKFGVSINVHPEQQGQGIGAALYDYTVAALAPFEPILVRARAREDYPRATRFLIDRGFVEDMREWESRLDVGSFDPTPYADAEARMQSHGLVIKSLLDLESDPNRDRKLYAMDMAVAADVPSPDPFTPTDFEHYQQMALKNPGLIPEAFLVAVDGDEYVGVSTLWRSKASTDLYNGLTGVLRSHRRKGIALALKLRNIAWAQAQGVPSIKTWNESNNRGMLTINEQLGFVKQPAWVNYHKDLG